jgi:enterochelin esterase family protein
MATEATTRRTGPLVDDRSVTFRVPLTERQLAGVRLWQQVRVAGEHLPFSNHRGVWSLRLARPAVDRMEYLLELRHPDGRVETVPDPSNPLRVRSAFGEHSVIEFPGYAPPAWLHAPAPPGSRTDGLTTSSNLSGEVTWQVWRPRGLPDDEPAPLLLVNDGPEYDHLAAITTYVGALVAGGHLPPLRVALLAPGQRNERYSANAAYSRAVARAVLPDLYAAFPASKTIGVGASLGALSLLHLQRHHPGVLDGLFLQSGSFFHRRLDAQERWFPRFSRIERFTSEVLRAEAFTDPVPLTLTCGAIEENVDNNRMMVRALAAQGYDADWVEVPDVHNYTAWRDALDPHLTRLVARVVSKET